MIENPQPAWLPLLLFALPGITFAAFAINEAVFSQTNRPLCTVPAIGIVLALMPTHLLALAFGSLTVGLSGAWVAVAVAGYLWAAWRGRRFRGAIAVDGAGRTRLGIAFLATIPIVLPTILFNFFDEVSFNGHLAIIAHLQNGTYPPRYLYEPNFPLRYHYAFDLAAAIVTALTQVRLDHAVDLLTVGLWPCMFLLLWRVGEHFGGKRAGLFVAFTVSFSAGLCSFCPIFVNFYFQHPWSIGTPIFCLVILQHAALRQSPHQVLSLVAFVCCLSFLALCQAVLFVTTVAALGVAEAWRAVRYCDRYAVSMLILICVAVLFAKLMGEFSFQQPIR